MDRKTITGEKLVNLVLLIASVFYLSYSLTHYDLGTKRMPKEGFMPMIIGIGMVAISGWLTIKAFLNKGDAQNVKFNISWLRLGAIVAVSLVYALVLTALGYTISTALFLLAIFKLSGLGGWIKPSILAVGCSAAFFCLFKLALGVMLPGGFKGF
ncbi:MAG: tripartite tricarboxylate transporter TctB family protein [Sphaerochaetaceae bacterium]|jgi:hypothetical protein|nr:tripartite tricarboxylate transporter TctB family protein [Sphaerochaetaceae bacterium]